MCELKIIIKPSKSELTVRVEDKFFFDVCKILDKLKTSQKQFDVNIPEIGYCGMFLTYKKSKFIYVNNEMIIFKNDNITEIFFDQKKKINNLLLRTAAKKYNKELSYFFEVKNTTEKRKNKKIPEKDIIGIFKK